MSGQVETLARRDWLFGGDGPSRDRDWYRNNLTGGRTALSVLVPENQDWTCPVFVERLGVGSV